ncbi:MAG: hypothetical protein H6Q87_1151, partial [candidate division NC10 bacterium]|nr:hypothetical protein [candidate division NC10 bacterium]
MPQADAHPDLVRMMDAAVAGGVF